MKSSFKTVLALTTAIFTVPAWGQGNFQYDQESATVQSFAHYGALIQSQQPIGQSFTPTSSSVGFVQFKFDDGSLGNGLGATIYVNLWSDSLGSGTLVGSTAPVFMQDHSVQLIATFLFSNSVTVAPGSTYYFQPVVVQPGSDADWLIMSDFYDYSGGTAYFNGAPTSNVGFDLWFREGNVVPEPSVVSLIMLGVGGALAAYRRRKMYNAIR